MILAIFLLVKYANICWMQLSEEKRLAVFRNKTSRKNKNKNTKLRELKSNPIHIPQPML